MNSWLAVAIGGAAGSVARYAVVLGAGHWLGTGFPFGTMIVNVAGSFVMGALAEIFALWWGNALRPLLMIGFLGGFTTFSSFSLDAVALFERGAVGAAAIYVLGSVILAIGGLLAGLWVVRILA
jgi:CrcB protein